MNMKRLLWGFLMIAAVALVGCSSDGGTSLMIDGNRATQAAIDQLVMEADALDDVRMALGEDYANADLDMIKSAIMGLGTDSEALAAVRTALGPEAATATKDELVDKIDDLNDASTTLAAVRAHLDDDDASAEEINKAIGPMAMAPSEMDLAIQKAIMGAMRVADGTMVLTPGDDSNDTKASIAIDLDPSGGKAGSPEIVIEDAMDYDKMKGTGANMTSDLDQFTQDGSMIDMGNGFNKSVQTKTGEDRGMDTVTIITDMQAPGSMTFADYYMINDRPGVSGMASTDAATLGRVTIAVSGDNVDLSLLSSSAFPTGAVQTYTYTDDDPATAENEETWGGRTLDGRFNDVEGKFMCTGESACTAMTDSANKLVSLAGTWTFTPDDTKSTIQGVAPDGDFLAFGYWMNEMTGANGDTMYSVSTFADGALPYPLAKARDSALEGTATYSGPAAGKYARETVTSDSEVATLRVGDFTAEVNLTATFGQVEKDGEGTLSPNMLHTVSGDVSKFTDENGDMLGIGSESWEVELMTAGFASGDQGIVKQTFSGGTTGGGKWIGGFYGPDQMTDDQSNMTKVMPSGVAGTFDASFKNGEVAGAFGATKD